MATAGVRKEVELALSITTANADSLRQLRDSVKALAKEGGDAAPEFERLAAELDTLAQQARQFAAVDSLSTRLTEAKVAMEGQSAAAADLKTKLAGLEADTKNAAANEDRLKVALAEARAEVTAKAGSLASLRAGTAEADRDSLAYRSTLASLTSELTQAKNQVKALQVEQAEAAAATRAAKDAQREFGREVAAANAAVNQSATVVRNLEVSLTTANTRLVEAGASSTDLAEAQKRVVDGFAAAQQTVRAYVAEQERATNAAREAAREEERLAAIVEGTRKAQAAQAKAEADGIIRDYERMQQAQRQAAQSAQEAADKINQAFKATGAGAVRELEQQIRDVRAGMELLRTSGALTGDALERAMTQANAKIKALERDLREATGQLTLMDKAAGLLKGTLGQIAVFISLTEVVQRAGRAFFEATKQIESLRLGLTQIYGSAQIAADQINVLRSAANLGGVAVGDISASFVKFAASTNAANIPIGQANDLFIALTRAAGTLGLSSEKTNQALEALSQIAGKGVLSLEELRQQLGDAIPGATALAAKGLGITQAELFKLVEAGKITARDFFPAFTDALKGLNGEVTTLSAGLARLQNALTATFQSIGDAGVVTTLKIAVSATTEVLSLFGLGLTTILETVRFTIQGFRDFVGTLVGGGSIVSALQAAGNQVTLSLDKLVLFRDVLFGNAEAAAAARARLDALRDGTAGVGTSTDAAGESVKLSTNAWVRFGQVAVLVTDYFKDQNAQMEKSVEATDLAGKARIELARIIGDETGVLAANAQATQANAEKIAERAALRERELVSVRQQVEAMRLLAAAEGDPDGTRAKQIAELSKTLELREADARLARQQADQARVVALAAEVEAEKHRDNSAALGEYAIALETSRVAVEALQRLKAAGVPVDDALKAATERLARAEALYRDALDDTTKALEANNGARKADAALAEANLQLSLAEYKSLEATAKALGDQNLARFALIEQKKVEIQILQATVQAAIVEQQGIIAVTRAKIDAAVASNKLTEVMRIELESQIKVAEAAIVAAKARGQSVTALELEIKALREGTQTKGENKGASDGAAASLANEAAARGKNAEAIVYENSLLKRNRELKGKEGQTYDAEGYATNPDGSRQTMAGSGTPTNNIILGSRLTGGSIGSRQDAINAAFGDPRLAVPDKSSSSSSAIGETTTTRASVTQTTTTVQPVVINLNGSSTTLNVASRNDANILNQVLQQLVSANGVSA